jgi:ISXO2-like transposase domain
VITDGWTACLALPEARFIHERIVEGSGTNFVDPVPNLHRMIGNLKAWLNGTLKGVSRHNLAAYLDEFVFRHNRRLNLAAAFQTLLGIGTTRDPTTYDTIIGTMDIPRVTYAPSQKRTGERERRRKLTPAAATMMTNP